MQHDPTRVVTYASGDFEPDNHFYPKVLNAQMHPLVRAFFGLGNERIAKRYAHLHPEVEPDAIRAVLAERPARFRWGGSDLFHVTTPKGVRRVVVIETNSCPSGQKSTPFDHTPGEQAGYRSLLEGAFLPMLKRRGAPKGALAVLWDKNPMEASGYAATLADLTGEPVHLVPCFDGAAEPVHRVADGGLIEFRGDDGRWQPIRACLRYVTQRPWNRLPVVGKTLMFNPILVCLAGGRNKLLAAKAYDLENAALRNTGLRIRTPETIWDVGMPEVPMWIERMGGVGVVKNPYTNAGQGVWTITNREELDAFMALDVPYDRLIVQSLIGNSGWSSDSPEGRLYHIGTLPDRRSRLFVADVRFMVGGGPDGFFPVAIYARRSRSPLAASLDDTGGATSWDMLGTNLSVKRADGGWDTETERLMLVDNRDFNRLGIGLDELIEGYLQTVLSVRAIDRMAEQLLTQKGAFRKRFFRSVVPDASLAEEILG